MYHTRLMNVLWAWRVSKKMFAIFFANTLNKEKKAVYLYPLKEGDVFYGIFYGYKRIKGNRFFNDYASVCRFSKKNFKTFNKAYYLEFRFKTGSVFMYVHTISYFVDGRNIRSIRKLYKKILKLEQEVFKFYSKDLQPEGIITKWVSKIKQKREERLDQIGNLINPPPHLRVRSRFRKF
ncbi:conserved hypothetical protein (plasmid) [Borreliella bissettiae DN127]|uniref:Cytosolic protein n=1 Tax=Borrelia bissettiae (strain DSM 17990 / CIP 109136 / DN127) TaxID=521010 RepID=G0AP08_BORBD|nr:DUF226 domain-containing protein [Borreliella bissettiae]AEL19434.1 conserved hypothetical protein [Borreliella bissettiae DN127]